MTFAPTAIDLTRLTPPTAIEVLSHDALRLAFLDRFSAEWEAERAIDPSLPVWDVGGLEANPVARVMARCWSYLRLLDRQRVNDEIKALLAPLATGSDLDNLVARQNVQRLVIRPATGDQPAIMESDAALLRRYLLAFDKPSAGSADRYLLEAFTAWPEMLDARVNGFDVHGRRGDTDVVIIGPNGDTASPAKRALVSAAVRASRVKPEAVSVAVLDARRVLYSVDLTIEMAPGPDATVIRDEVIRRVSEAGRARTLIGGEIPPGFIAAAAYGPNVIKVRDNAPVVIEPDPYAVPVLVAISVSVEVRG